MSGRRRILVLMAIMATVAVCVAGSAIFLLYQTALAEERNRLVVLSNPTLAHRRGTSPVEDFEYRHDRSQTGSGYYIYLSPPDTAVNR